MRVADSASEEVSHGCRDLSGMRFEREVSGIEEADGRIGNVALERFGTGSQFAVAGGLLLMRGQISNVLCKIAVVMAILPNRAGLPVTRSS
jgi:hypothetical protein